MTTEDERQKRPLGQLVLETLYEDARKYASDILPRITEQQNRYVRCVAEALLQLNDAQDVKAFALNKNLLEEFNLRREYGIDPSPLFNLNYVAATSGEFIELVSSRCKTEEADICVRGDEVMHEITQIRTQRLLGKHTEAKLAYIRDLSRVSFTTLLHDESARRNHLDARLRQVQETTYELLRRQRERLGTDASKVATVENMMQKIGTHVFRHRILELATAHPDFLENIPLFCYTYADEIAQCLGEHGANIVSSRYDLRHKKGRGIEVAYSPRNGRFFSLGDLYGDCTARNEKRQVELNMTNIHWTVYAWFLDPYYRVLEAYVDGDSVIKGHITPLIIRGVRTLALDAIEVVPKIRDTLKKRRNQYLSQELFQRRRCILDALLETTKHIGEHMGVGQVLVDKFSGASWVREMLDALPPMFYHVNDVEKPFGTKAISALVSDVMAMNDVPVKEEIQFVNLGLAAQGLRYGYKEAGVLYGEPTGFVGAISGP